MILERLAPYKGILVQGSGKFLLVEFGILGFKIQNTGQGIRIPLTIGIPNIPLTKIRNPVAGMRNFRRGIQISRLPWIPSRGGERGIISHYLFCPPHPIPPSAVLL